jgi:hypothetical protein
MAREEAQRNGVDVAGLANDQVFEIVKRNIVTKRYCAFLGLVVAIIVSVVCTAYFLINRHVDYKQTVGPLTLASGETRSIDFDLGRRGAVTVTIDSIVPDWTGLEKVFKGAFMAHFLVRSTPGTSPSHSSISATVLLFHSRHQLDTDKMKLSLIK